MFLSIMCHAYTEEQLENGESRVVLKLPAALAPTKLAVLPLVKKGGLPEKAREIIDQLKFHFNCVLLTALPLTTTRWRTTASPCAIATRWSRSA